RGDIQVHDDRILATPDHHYLDWLARTRVHLLMRHIWRDIDEIAWAGLVHKLEMIAPPHSRPAADDIEDALQLAVMMCAGLGVGLHHHRACPQLAGARAGMGDRRGPS